MTVAGVNTVARRTVSIVLPTYNGASHLLESVASCLSQTYGDIELIIVDDCSTDETPHLVAAIGDTRVKRIRNETNQGLPRSLNIGFRQSNGAYLTWTSDDNLYAPSAIEEMVRYLETNPDVAFVYTDYWTIDEKGNVIQRSHLDPPEALHLYNCVNACFLYRRMVYEAVSDYDPAMAMAEDYEYWLRIYHRFKMEWLPSPMYYYRVHPDSLTSREGLVKQQRAVERAKQKWFGSAPFVYPSRYARSLAYKYMDLAFASFKAGNRPATRRHVVEAVRLDPRWLNDLGVWSIFLESTIGPEATDVVRLLARPFTQKTGDGFMTYTYNDMFMDWTPEIRRSAEAVVPFLLEWVQPQSVVDVGCGVGSWLAVFQEHGASDVLGLDGAWVDRSLLEVGADKFQVTDLANPVTLDRVFDLALSLEVAEHLPAEAATGFVASLVGLSSVVLFSAAVPGQGGVEHVNEQWPQYWRDLFARHDYALIDIRAHFWSHQAILPWYRQNMLLFVDRSRLPAYPALQALHAGAVTRPLDVVHPDMFLLRIAQYENQVKRLSDARNVPARQAIAALPAIVTRAVARRLPGAQAKPRPQESHDAV